MKTREFIHPALNIVVESISGYYEYTMESTIDVEDKKVLFLRGYSVTDRSCCGVGGCIFVSIPGYVIDFKHTQQDDGTFISTVEPVVNEKERIHISRFFMENGYQPQVIFME